MYKKHVLNNGLRIVTEHIPYVKSISIGVWIETGSKKEAVEENGISHFIEHMLFKGTKTRSAKDIAEAIDAVGGQINAFTGKECTCYYVKVLDSHFDLAIDVLSDMVFNSNFDPNEIDKERSVILEEISMYEDSPEDLVHDLFSQTIFMDSALGYPILGTKESLENLNQSKMLEYMSKHYRPNNAVISVAGNFDEHQLLKEIDERFGRWEQGSSIPAEDAPLNYYFGMLHKAKDIEQTHLCLGFRGIEMGNKEIYPLMAINNILGGSMSSRLFQSIREERGLVYSVYSYPTTYKTGGLFAIYAGMNPQQLEEVCHLIKKELINIVSTGLSGSELHKAKEQLKGNYILGLESTSSRMTSIGKSELLLQRIYSPKEVLQLIDDIKMPDIDALLEKIIKTDQVAATIVSKKDQKEIVEMVFKTK